MKLIEEAVIHPSIQKTVTSNLNLNSNVNSIFVKREFIDNNGY